MDFYMCVACSCIQYTVYNWMWPRLVLSVVAALAPLRLGAWGQPGVSVAPSCVVSGGGAGPVAAGCVGSVRGECGPVLCCQWWRRWPRCGWVRGASQRWVWPRLVLSVVAALAPLRLGAWGQPEVNLETMQTPEPWLFCAGDLAGVSQTSVEAVNDGKQAAWHMHRFLQVRPPSCSATRSWTTNWVGRSWKIFFTLLSSYIKSVLWLRLT